MIGSELLLLQELGRAGAHSPRISFMSLLFGMLQVCAPSRPSSTNEIVVCWQDEISTRRKKERSKPDEPAALPSEDFAEVRKRPDGEKIPGSLTACLPFAARTWPSELTICSSSTPFSRERQR